MVLHAMIFLEPADVERLTGRKRASAQLAFCRENGIQAWLSGRGEVVIPRAAIEGRKTEATEEWAPDFGPIRKRA